jgi:hypothetical protein
VLAAVRWGAVVIGVGAGALATTLLALGFWGVLEIVGVEEPALAGLTAALLVGFAVAGYAAGRLTAVFARFHGSLAGFGLAGLTVVIARLGGSPAPTTQVLLLAGLGVLLGGAGGVVAGRHLPFSRAEHER